MEFNTFLAFWAISILFVITPGADWAYAITAGLRYRSVVPAIGGLLAGHLIATVAVAEGVAAVLAGSPTVLTAITIAGAAYLVGLGVGMLRAPATTPVPAPEPTFAVATSQAQVLGAGTTARYRVASDRGRGADDWVAQAARGLGVSGLNPKVFLLFLALLPQFVNPNEAWPVAGQIVSLGLVHVASCAVVYTLVATGARKVLRARPEAARNVTRFSGAALVVIGLVLVVEQLIA